MIRNFMFVLLAVCSGLVINPAIAGQFVVELDAPLNLKGDALSAHSSNLTLDESFAAGQDSYAVFTASDLVSLNQFLELKGIRAEKGSEVLFVNSPVIGGGKPARENPLEGHKVYVIERPIPGVGLFGLEKKKISKGSNAAIAKLGEVIEWNHSYLTSEGTYCVYRADSPETLRKHGALAGAPISKITPVEHKKH